MADYVLVNDIHICDRAPSSCTDTYLDDLFALLRAVGDIAVQRGARAIIWAGDVFHFKTPGRTSHRTIIALIELLRSIPVPTYVVPGNHDMQNDRIDSIDETQPLGVVLASGALHLLDKWMQPPDTDDTGPDDPVYGVPWLQRFTDDTVSAALDDYRFNLDVEGWDSHHTLVVTHAPLYPLGQELPYENYPADRWAAAMDGHGSVHYGHVHTPHGIHTAGGVTFCNPGALSRGSLHEYNLTRPVQIAVWSSDTGEFEIVPVPHKPAAEVFRLVEATEAKTAEIEFDRFLDQIGNTCVGVVSIEAVMEHVRRLKLEPPVQDTIVELLAEGAT